MIYLTKRLKSLYSLIEPCEVFADVGTDHAYIPCAVLNNGLCEKAIASDIRQGPLKNAEKTVIKENLSEKVELRISDGLKAYSKNEADEICMSGIGGLLISDIINDTTWLKNKKTTLILQPTTHHEAVRNALYKNGFKIEKEFIFKDGAHYYLNIKAYYTGKQSAADPFQAYFGSLIDSKNYDDIKYCSYIYTVLKNKYMARTAKGIDEAELKTVLKKYEEKENGNKKNL